MKSKTFLTGCLAGLLSLYSCNNPSTVIKDYAAYVDPFIGTGGHGHTFPGAVLPHGMIQPSDVLLIPTVGTQHYLTNNTQNQQLPYASSFSDRSEVAEPGYYSVFLDTYQVKAEQTATRRSVIHRYTFPESQQAGFILDLDYNLQQQKNKEMMIEVVSDTEIRGRKKTAYRDFDQDISFYAKFSKPFTYTLITDTISGTDGEPTRLCKALIQFPTQKDEMVLVKIGISAVDTEGAKHNLQTEIPHWDFDRVCSAARSTWNNYLAKIDIESVYEEQKTAFYTALYHTAISPNLFSDADGRYRGMDQRIHQGDTIQPMYTNFSLWSTFRALHPLLTIIDPELNNQFIQSLITKQHEGGILPQWEVAGNYTGAMIGYHAVSVIVDAYTKGYRDFDVQEAYRACLRATEYDPEDILCPPAVLPHLMPQAKYFKNAIGYIPCDRENESVAKALEYAYDDWCISVFAEALNDFTNQKKYARLAKAYEFYFDESTRFMRGLDSRGEWSTPFNPLASSHPNDDYYKGTAWQWTWFVPHDIEGLVKLMGGREAFSQKLDSLFTADIGQYTHGNEPSHHIIHLYNYINQPWKTQELIDNVLSTQYTNTSPDDLSGNEDCGQMSAWYVMNALGFYQVCPGKPIYSIGCPLFEKATIMLPDDKTFQIITRNNSQKNMYIEKAFLNGEPLHTPFFTHQELAAGGVLEFIMGSHPTAD